MYDLTQTFSALGDPTRFAVVQQLLSDGPSSVQMLQKQSDVSPPAFSRHLKVLRQAGIVSQTIDKQRRIYAVKPQAVQAIHQWTMDHHKFWSQSVDRLERALNEFDMETNKREEKPHE